MLEINNSNPRLMNRNFLVLLILLPLFFSCSPKQGISEKKVPVNIIQPDSMVSVIVDMQLTEAVFRELKRIGQYEEKNAKVSFEAVFIKHNISKEKYEESVAYYEQNLETYEKIYENVITRLSQIQTETLIPKDEEYD